MSELNDWVARQVAAIRAQAASGYYESFKAYGVCEAITPEGIDASVPLVAVLAESRDVYVYPCMAKEGWEQLSVEEDSTLMTVSVGADKWSGGAMVLGEWVEGAGTSPEDLREWLNRLEVSDV